MLRAKDIMTTELITISPRAEIAQATRFILERGINGIPADKTYPSASIQIYQ